MTKQQHIESARPRDEGGFVEHAAPSRREEGSAWAKTSQDRAQECVPVPGRVAHTAGHVPRPGALADRETTWWAWT